MSFEVRNAGAAQASDMCSARDFLRSLPTGSCATTCRTVCGGSSVLMLQFHLNLLNNAMKAVCIALQDGGAPSDGAGLVAGSDERAEELVYSLRGRTISALKRLLGAMATAQRAAQEPAAERSITIAWYADADPASAPGTALTFSVAAFAIALQRPRHDVQGAWRVAAQQAARRAEEAEEAIASATDAAARQVGLEARQLAATESARLPGAVLQLMQPPSELAAVEPSDARWQDVEALLPPQSAAAAAGAAATNASGKEPTEDAGDAGDAEGAATTWLEVAFTNGHAVTQAAHSGVFAVRSGTVQAAVDGVTPDSMRELVFIACEQLGIPLLYVPPALAESKLWEAAFITHPAVGLVPVSAIRARREACPHLRGSSGQPITAEDAVDAGAASAMPSDQRAARADGWAAAGEVAAVAANKTAAGDDSDGSIFVPVRPSTAAVNIVSQLTALVSSELLRPREVQHTKLIESSSAEGATKMASSSAGGAAAPAVPCVGFAASMAAAKQKRENALAAEAADDAAAACPGHAVVAPASPKPHVDKVASLLHSRMRVALSDGR